MAIQMLNTRCIFSAKSRWMGFSLALILLNSAASLAQQRPQYTLYFQNNYIINPAITGIEDFFDVKLSYRKQWVGINGAPTTSYLTAQGPVSDATRAHSGIGLTVIDDKTGPTARFSAGASYAYHLLVSEKAKLSFGLSGGFTQYSLQTSQLVFNEAFDPAIPRNTTAQLIPDLTAGVWYYTNQFYIGGSVNQLLPSQLYFDAQNRNPQNKLQPHEFFTAGYRFSLNENVTVIPSFMIKRVTPVPVSYDINAKILFHEAVWVGGSYRKTDGFSVVAGVYVNAYINVSYGYDYTTSALQKVTSGSHEVILGILFGNKEHVRCPKNVW